VCDGDDAADAGDEGRKIAAKMNENEVSREKFKALAKRVLTVQCTYTYLDLD
jgi:hypothetical protein